VIGELLAEKQPRPVDTALRAGDGDPEDLADLPVRQPLDIAQHDECPVLRGQLVDRRQDQPQLAQG
jgi:hypothetical protein